MQDIEDLQQLSVAHQVDFVSTSFVHKASDIDFIRSVLGPTGKDINIIPRQDREPHGKLHNEFCINYLK